jgi:GNAT superfamily N-acetyltransferase
MPPNIRSISFTELERILPALVDLLRDSVNAGASLGFLPPLTHDEGRRYWLSLRADLQAGARVLLAAFSEGRIVGSGQLMLPSWPNARHRAELQKLFVAAGLRERGVGKALMDALHVEARQRGRSLLLLNTRRGEAPEGFYKGLGYREVGVVPGYTRGPGGERFDNVTLYQDLLS